MIGAILANFLWNVWIKYALVVTIAAALSLAIHVIFIRGSSTLKFFINGEIVARVPHSWYSLQPLLVNAKELKQP
jgi:hypothetical protein